MSGYSQKSLRRYEGEIGENVARKRLEKQGFKVMSYMVLVDFVARATHVPKGYEKISRNTLGFLGIMKKNFVDMNRALDKVHFGKEHKRRRFDFIARRDNRYYVVEVKTNKAKVTSLQKEELQICKRFGFVPMVVRTKVSIVARMEDVKTETF